MALGFGSIVTSVFYAVWRGLFRRGRGWVLDCVLVAASGFALVITMMAYLMLIGPLIPKELQRVVGDLVLVGMAVLLVKTTARIVNRCADSKADIGGKGKQ